MLAVAPFQEDYSMLSRGFTLVEMMVAVAVLAILLTIGLPAFGGLIDSQRMDSSVNGLMRSIQFTRTEAIRLNRPVTMTPLGQDWNNGWIIFLDANHNGAHDSDERVLRYEQPALVSHIHANANIADYLRYNAQGESELLNGGFQSGTFSLCPQQTAAQGRKVIINRVGRARIERAFITSGCPG